MKTKAELLESHIKNLSLLPKLAVLQAMDDYAQQKAQEFLKWVEINNIKYDQLSDMYFYKPCDEYITRPQLYAKFIEEQKGG